MVYPTKQELENKKWYRLVKVSFIMVSILLAIASIGISILAYFDIYAPRKVYDDHIVKCNSGKEFKLKEITNRETVIVLPSDVKAINNKCEGITEYISLNLRTYSEKKYYIFTPYHIDGSYFKAMFYGILTFMGLIGISAFIVWIAHKTMLYIIYGKKDERKN